MRKLFEWYSRLPPWYQAPLLSLYFGIFLGFLVGAAMGDLGAALAGFLIGVIGGLAYYYRERRDKTQTDEAIDDYPEDLERVERQHARQWLILFPLLAATGIVVSWIIFGTGIYGAIVALPATVVASWTLGRFGGPNDPKWKKVRDEWKRQSMERNRAS